MLLHEQDQLNFVTWFENALKLIEQLNGGTTVLDMFAVEASDNNSAIEKGNECVTIAPYYRT